MFWFTVKILLYIILGAGLFFWTCRSMRAMWRNRHGDLHSLAHDDVQALADRADSIEEQCLWFEQQYGQRFFCAESASGNTIDDCFARLCAAAPENFPSGTAEHIKAVAAAMESDALIAYSLDSGTVPLFLTVHHAGAKTVVRCFSPDAGLIGKLSC